MKWKWGRDLKIYIFSKTFRAGLHSQQNLEEGTCFDNEYMKNRLNKNTVMPSQLQLPTSQKIKLVELITVWFLPEKLALFSKSKKKKKTQVIEIIYGGLHIAY